MMEILDLPERFRAGTPSNPKHQKGPNIEEACGLWAMERLANTSATYIPVYWQNLYCENHYRLKQKDYGADPELQALLDRLLQPDRQYFTVTQADEGHYERLPSNVYVFGAGGVGSEPIPLASSPHQSHAATKNTLACFVGCVETGGPAKSSGRPSRSSWDPDGAGAKVRRRMWLALQGRPGYYLKDQRGRNTADVRTFEFVMASAEFALCPRGYGRTSFRLYEAIQMGVIPVYIYDEEGPWLPYEGVLDWREFCVLCDYRELDALPSRLKGLSKAKKDEMRRRLFELYPTHFSIEGAAEQVRLRVEKLWPE